MTTHSMRQAAADASQAPGLTTTLIVLAVIVGATVLCYVDKINGDALVGLFSAILGGVLVRAGVASGSAASSAPPAGD
jgi:hypothetical protein